MAHHKGYRLKITKAHWYRLGGFANPKLFRKANFKGVWAYYMRTD